MNTSNKAEKKIAKLVIAAILIIFAIYFIGRAIGTAYYHYSH